MEYQEFVCAIEEEMNRRLEGGRKASRYTAVKNNGKVKQGIVMESPGVNISPTIYLEEYYQSFLDGEPLERIAEDILRFYHKIKREESWNSSRIQHYDQIREQIVFRVIHTEKNRALLEMLPHLELLDLSIVFYALLEIGEQGTATMTVNREHLCCWNVTAEELFRVACENMVRLLPAELVTMQQAVEEILHPLSGERQNLLEQAAAGEKEQMYVLSNSIRSFGAAYVAYPGMLERIGEILEEDYYVLPSSIHEVVLVPLSGGLSRKEMNAMVAEINVTQVAEEEVLSEHSYIYERETGKLVR